MSPFPALAPKTTTTSKLCHLKCVKRSFWHQKLSYWIPRLRRFSRLHYYQQQCGLRGWVAPCKRKDPTQSQHTALDSYALQAYVFIQSRTEIPRCNLDLWVKRTEVHNTGINHIMSILMVYDAFRRFTMFLTCWLVWYGQLVVSNGIAAPFVRCR